MNKSEFMREQLSDLSDSACTELYDSIVKGYLMEQGKILDKELYKAVFDHYVDSLDREDDEVERRLQREIDGEAA